MDEANFGAWTKRKKRRRRAVELGNSTLEDDGYGGRRSLDGSCVAIERLSSPLSPDTFSTGAMFTITAARPLTILTMEVGLNPVATDADDDNEGMHIEIYTKPGEFLQFLNDPPAWEQIVNTNVKPAPNGRTTLLPLNAFRPVDVRSVQQQELKQSFYVTLKTNDLRYTRQMVDNGNNDYSTFAEDENLSIQTGIGLADYGPFSNRFFSGRSFYGIFHYRFAPKTNDGSICSDDGTRRESAQISFELYLGATQSLLLSELVSRFDSAIQNSIRLMLDQKSFSHLKADHDVRFESVTTTRIGTGQQLCPVQAWSTCLAMQCTVKLSHLTNIESGRVQYLFLENAPTLVNSARMDGARAVYSKTRQLTHLSELVVALKGVPVNVPMDEGQQRYVEKLITTHVSDQLRGIDMPINVWAAKVTRQRGANFVDRRRERRTLHLRGRSEKIEEGIRRELVDGGGGGNGADADADDDWIEFLATVMLTYDPPLLVDVDSLVKDAIRYGKELFVYDVTTDYKRPGSFLQEVKGAYFEHVIQASFRMSSSGSPSSGFGVSSSQTSSGAGGQRAALIVVCLMNILGVVSWLLSVRIDREKRKQEEETMRLLEERFKQSEAAKAPNPFNSSLGKPDPSPLLGSNGNPWQANVGVAETDRGRQPVPAMPIVRRARSASPAISRLQRKNSDPEIQARGRSRERSPPALAGRRDRRRSLSWDAGMKKGLEAKPMGISSHEPKPNSGHDRRQGRRRSLSWDSGKKRLGGLAAAPPIGSKDSQEPPRRTGRRKSLSWDAGKMKAALQKMKKEDVASAGDSKGKTLSGTGGLGQQQSQTKPRQVLRRSLSWDAGKKLEALDLGFGAMKNSATKSKTSDTTPGPSLKKPVLRSHRSWDPSTVLGPGGDLLPSDKKRGPPTTRSDPDIKLEPNRGRGKDPAAPRRGQSPDPFSFPSKGREKKTAQSNNQNANRSIKNDAASQHSRDMLLSVSGTSAPGRAVSPGPSKQFDPKVAGTNQPKSTGAPSVFSAEPRSNLSLDLSASSPLTPTLMGTAGGKKVVIPPPLIQLDDRDLEAISLDYEFNGSTDGTEAAPPRKSSHNRHLSREDIILKSSSSHSKPFLDEKSTSSGDFPRDPLPLFRKTSRDESTGGPPKPIPASKNQSAPREKPTPASSNASKLQSHQRSKDATKAGRASRQTTPPPSGHLKSPNLRETSTAGLAKKASHQPAVAAAAAPKENPASQKTFRSRRQSLNNRRLSRVQRNMQQPQAPRQPVGASSNIKVQNVMSSSGARVGEPRGDTSNQRPAKNIHEASSQHRKPGGVLGSSAGSKNHGGITRSTKSASNNNAMRDYTAPLKGSAPSRMAPGHSRPRR